MDPVNVYICVYLQIYIYICLCLQSWTKYLSKTQVFLSNSALRKKFQFIFFRIFLLVLTIVLLWKEELALSYKSMKFWDFADIFQFPKILRRFVSLVVKPKFGQISRRYYIYIYICIYIYIFIIYLYIYLNRYIYIYICIYTQFKETTSKSYCLKYRYFNFLEYLIYKIYMQ